MRRVATLLAIVALSGCGAASAATRGYQVTDFSRLRVEGPFDVRVHVGGGAVVRATGPQQAIDRVIVEQSGDTLTIRPDRKVGWTNWNWGKGEALVIDVSTHALADAALGGSGNVAIDAVTGDQFALSVAGSGNASVGRVAVSRLQLAANGSGNVTAAGHAGSASLSLRGSGNIDTRALLADAAVIGLVGSGDITVGAKRSATVSLTGSGNVTVTGDARCTVARTGSGDVRCAGGDNLPR